MADQVLENKSRSGVVALVVGGHDVIGYVLAREILHRWDLVLEWGASAHVDVVNVDGKLQGKTAVTLTVPLLSDRLPWAC